MHSVLEESSVNLLQSRFLENKKLCTGSIIPERSGPSQTPADDPNMTSNKSSFPWSKHKQLRRNMVMILVLRTNAGQPDKTDFVSPTSRPTPSSTTYGKLTSSIKRKYSSLWTVRNSLITHPRTLKPWNRIPKKTAACTFVDEKGLQN